MSIDNNEQDALNRLYGAVSRLKFHGCDLDYILDCVKDAYDTQRDEQEEG